MQGYLLFRRGRQGRWGRGVAQYLMERLDCTAVSIGCTHELYQRAFGLGGWRAKQTSLDMLTINHTPRTMA